jgi:ATP-dependent exoDNAse (exonuclease V) beta subunit
MLSPMTAAVIPLSAKLDHTAYSDIYQSEREKKILDELNVVYVAMTRPVERLYVISKQVSDSRASVAQLLTTFLQSEQLWENGKNIYEFGEAVPRTTISSDESICKVFSLDRFSFCRWQKKARLRLSDAARKDEVSESRQARGIVYHRLISEIQTADDISPALERALIRGDLTLAEKDDVARRLTELVSHPRMTVFFSSNGNIKSEFEMVDRNGMTYRPDRVVFEGDNVFVSDFKTGQANDKHREQIGRYASLLSEIGYKVRGCLLVYIDDMNFVDAA